MRESTRSSVLAALAGVSAAEAAQRLAVVTEALTWLGTPYHHEARVKGEGVDCAYFLREVFAAAGIVPRAAIPHYPRDWHMHRDEERYLSFILEHGRPVNPPYLPADVPTYKIGRCVSHAAIIVAWPRLIHAYYQEKMVVLTSAETPFLADRARLVYRLKGWT